MLIALIALLLASMNAFVLKMAENILPIRLNLPSPLGAALVAAVGLAIYIIVTRLTPSSKNGGRVRTVSVLVDAHATPPITVKQSRGAA